MDLNSFMRIQKIEVSGDSKMKSWTNFLCHVFPTIQCNRVILDKIKSKTLILYNA